MPQDRQSTLLNLVSGNCLTVPRSVAILINVMTFGMEDAKASAEWRFLWRV